MPTICAEYSSFFTVVSRYPFAPAIWLLCWISDTAGNCASFFSWAVIVNVLSAVEALDLSGDEATGRNIVLRALEEPVRQIALNAGFEGSIVIDRLKNSEAGTGFNAATGEWVNMIDAGIIDPVKVTRSALQNAASVAGLILTTEAVVANQPEPASPTPAMDPSMMGGMM